MYSRVAIKTPESVYESIRFKTEAGAQKVVDSMKQNAADPWTYKIKPAGDRFVVELFDSDGDKVGLL